MCIACCRLVTVYMAVSLGPACMAVKQGTQTLAEGLCRTAIQECSKHADSRLNKGLEYKHSLLM